jgi:hypothetical protein
LRLWVQYLENPTEKSGSQNLDFREDESLAEYDQITVQDRQTQKQIN